MTNVETRMTNSLRALGFDILSSFGFRHSSFICCVALIAVLFHASRALSGEPAPQRTDVFIGGQDGYPVYRIPAILTTHRGTVLAVAEGRARLKDIAENDIVLKRSMDGGKTFGPLMVVAAAGDDSLNNPLLMEIRPGGRVLLMYQHYPARTGEKEVVPGLSGDRICRTMIVQSDDEGQTWTKPRDITAGTKRPAKVTSVASGPGVGIQLRRGQHKGRLLAPFNQGPHGDWRVYAAISDDGGENWRYGETAPEGGPGHANEVQMVELADGNILLNARTEGGDRCRKMAVSGDGGESWSPLADVRELVDPKCMGSIIRYSDPLDGDRSRLLFSNAADAKHRRNGTLRLSYDEGKTWNVSRVLEPGDFAYSCLTVLPGGSIGCLYEGDDYKRIILARVELSWLTHGKNTAAPAGSTQPR